MNLLRFRSSPVQNGDRFSQFWSQQSNPAANGGQGRIGSFSKPRREDPVEDQYAAMNAQTERIIEGK
jgi:hypothetical protein